MSAPQTWEVRARFVALNPPFQGRDFPIVIFPAMIGRGTECGVFLDAASVSRQHAVVEEKDGRFRIRDLGSRNGVKLADQPIHEADLNAGDVVTVGDIQLQFEPVPAVKPAAAETAAAKTPAAPRTLTGQDVVTLMQSSPAAVAGTAEGEVESQPRVGLNMKMIAAVVAALVLSATAGVFILRHMGRAGEAPRAQWPSVMVKVGEKKWIQISRWQYVKEPNDVWWTPMDYHDHDIREMVVGGMQGSSKSAGGDTGTSIVAVEKYDPGEILITGKSVGETGLTITLDDGRILTMRVIVRGRLEDPLEPLLFGRYPASERVLMAEQFLNNGIGIEKEKPYLALQEYQKAKAVLTPISEKNRGDLYYLQIIPRLARAQRTVDDRWNELRGKISMDIASKEWTIAMDGLQEAVKLVPDPNDPRHQKAEGVLRSLIRRQLEERQ